MDVVFDSSPALPISLFEWFCVACLINLPINNPDSYSHKLSSMAIMK